MVRNYYGSDTSIQSITSIDSVNSSVDMFSDGDSFDNPSGKSTGKIEVQNILDTLNEELEVQNILDTLIKWTNRGI